MLIILFTNVVVSTDILLENVVFIYDTNVLLKISVTVVELHANIPPAIAIAIDIAYPKYKRE